MIQSTENKNNCKQTEFDPAVNSFLLHISSMDDRPGGKMFRIFKITIPDILNHSNVINKLLNNHSVCINTAK